MLKNELLSFKKFAETPEVNGQVETRKKKGIGFRIVQNCLSEAQEDR